MLTSLKINIFRIGLQIRHVQKFMKIFIFIYAILTFLDCFSNFVIYQFWTLPEIKWIINNLFFKNLRINTNKKRYVKYDKC